MNVIRLPLDEVKRPARNVRIHTEPQLKEFARSITMFGQIRPIVIDEENSILAGVGCYEALLRLERTEGDFFKVEGLTENQKKKLMIADNKIFGLGIDDLDTFNDFLEELKTDLDIPGYDEELLRSMVATADEVSEKINEYGTIGQDDVDSIMAAQERKESFMNKSLPSPEPVPVVNDTPAEPPEESVADVEKSVTCPKCGERIWL